MDDDLRAALADDIDRSVAHLRGAMHGLSDRLREMSSPTTASGYAVNRRFNLGNIDSGAPLTPLAEELALEMAAIVGECTALDAMREFAKKLDSQ